MTVNHSNILEIELSCTCKIIQLKKKKLFSVKRLNDRNNFIKLRMLLEIRIQMSSFVIFNSVYKIKLKKYLKVVFLLRTMGKWR